jgi:hypothetical protein
MEESNDALLEDELALVDGVVDYRGQPAIRSKSGYWRSAWFIIGTVSKTHNFSYLFATLKMDYFIAAEISIPNILENECNANNEL